MLVYNLHKYHTDRSAFVIDDSFKDWARSIAFDDYTLWWCKNNSSNYFTTERYFPPNEKKFNDQLASLKFLNLTTCSNKEILDLGTGVGYFCTLANRLGHFAEGTEIKEVIQSSVKELYQNYRIKVFELLIKNQQEIKLDKKYDYITAIRTWFNSDSEYFSTKDWLFLKENLMNFIKPGGGILLKTNYKFLKNNFRPEQIEILNAFGEPLIGWNSFTYFIKK